MSPLRKWTAATVSVVVALLVTRVVLNQTQPDDQTLIVRALDRSIQDSKEGKIGGVLDLLSRRFEFNDIPADRGEIARFIRENKPDVEVLNPRAVIAGEEARMVTPVRVKFGFLGQSISQEVPEVTLMFRREDTLRWGFVPTRGWKLTDVQAPQTSVNQFVR